VEGGLLTGRVAVVTGGAGGIGGAVCDLFAGEGADVVVGDIDRERTRQVVERVRAKGRRAVPVVADLTKKAGINRLFKTTTREFGGADILINGLGKSAGRIGPFEEQTDADWQADYEMNLLHVFRATHAFLPAMKERGWGRIVNFSSVEGIRSAPSFTVYSCFKRAVDGFTKSLAVDVARHGVLVNSVAVDKTRTYQVGFYELPDEYARLAGTWIPAGRYGEPMDVAKAVLFLASDLNTWVVGHTLVADGGTLAAGGWYRTPKRWTNQPLLTQYIEKDPGINERRPVMVQ
jgi:NAD(P)-dependent dehydrogenase (short-subunit alcohol dehydrogenase family)